MTIINTTLRTSSPVILHAIVTADDVLDAVMDSRPLPQSNPIAFALERAGRDQGLNDRRPDVPYCLIFAHDECRVGGLYGRLPRRLRKMLVLFASGYGMAPCSFSIVLHKVDDPC